MDGKTHKTANKRHANVLVLIKRGINCSGVSFVATGDVITLTLLKISIA